jgi:DNA-binding transcriptional ArsR family regulator
VTDVRALRALAHPLRNRLLGRLRMNGPATASQLGRAVGESSGATSYHLRQLEGYGFVEEIEGHGTARERWWRARHRMTSWQAGDIVDQEGGAEVENELARMQVDVRGRIFEAWQSQKTELDPAWTAAASLNDYGMRLRPEEARELSAELHALMQRWIAAHPGETPVEGTELVFVFTDLVPVRRYPS